MRSLFVVVLVFVFVTSCATVFTDLKIQERMRSGLIRVGSSQKEIISSIGRPSFACVRTKMSINGKYELWDYASRGCGVLNFAHGYVFIFKDSSLIEIRTVKTELDMRF
jgi:hypothetical protein